MLREGKGFVEAVAKEVATLLVLEDLHWSDASTLDLLTLLVQQTRPARLLLLCTFRPSSPSAEHSVDAIAARAHAKGDASVLSLAPLDPGSIATYLELRLADPARAGRLAPELEARRPETRSSSALSSTTSSMRTGTRLRVATASGTPRGSNADSPRQALSTPRALQEVIDRHLDSLPDGLRTVLEAASVAGMEFSAVEVAQAVAREPEQVDAELHCLARAGRIVVHGKRGPSTPDEPSGYGFVHAAYRAPSTSASRRSSAAGSTRASRALEASAGARLPLAGARLARHFRAAGDSAKAIAYLRLAAETAAGRFAHREAVRCLEEAAEGAPAFRRPRASRGPGG
jgi:hypothetical protein